MSKSFLKVSEAYNKLGLSGGGTNWIRKSELIATGKCDTTKLEKYGNNDFVVDDDIVKSESWKTIFSFSGTSSGDTTKTMAQNFDTSKSFRILGTIKWNSITWGQGRAITIYNTGAHILQINVNDADKSTRYLNILVMDANNSWIWFDTKGQSFSYGINYDFYLYYDAKAKNINAQIGTTKFYHPNINIKVGSFSKLMLSGSPEWANGDCNVTFSNFKVELLV